MKRLPLVPYALLLLLAACSDDPQETGYRPNLSGTSPYIHEVLEYVPAPGQFINELPQVDSTMSYQDILDACTDYIAGTAQGSLISLGTFGGYITFRFDHSVPNGPGSDIRILGNSFLASADPSGYTTGGSFEPGIVMVAKDINNDGLPNDPWYELRGGAHDYATKGYRITYRLHNADSICWSDNQSNAGVIVKNAFHSQPYFPIWCDSVLTFTGTLLPDNALDQSGAGVYWVQYPYARPYGYADAGLNDSEFSTFDFDWAVDTLGNPVQLDYVDFVRVYSALNQYCGWLGETSTEIMGAVDLHALGDSIVVDTTFTVDTPLPY